MTRTWARVVPAALLALALLAPAAAPAQVPPAPRAEVADEDRAAIRRVVADQLAAFGRDDAEGAFGHASPSVRRMFGSPERFMDVVRRSYRPVYRPREVQFLEVVSVHGRTAQLVYVVGPDGRALHAYYFMERQADGSWRIDGCVLLPAPERSA